jgi:hypothetical protein
MDAQPKIDFRKTRKELFSASADDFERVELPPVTYLMIDGKGSPGTSEAYRRALETLYPAAYGLKFYSKTKLGRDYVVPPLQGLWWAEERDAFTSDRRDEWLWTLMIMVPDWIEPGQFDASLAETAHKKPETDFGPLRMKVLAEGLCLQTLHIGSFADEAPVLHRLHHEVMPREGLTFNGKHHEIYLRDPRRTAPEKLRTVLRQPVRPA